MAFKTEHNQKKESLGRIAIGQKTGRGQSDKIVSLNKSESPLQRFDKTILCGCFSLGNSGKILIADAKNDVREFMADLLSKMGYEPISATSWIEALKLFTTSDFDLVFTDSKIIGWDGFSLAFHIKARSPQTPVVMLVDKSSGNSPNNQEGCCMDDLLFKPFGSKDIQRAIQKFHVTHSGEKVDDFHSKSSAL